MSDRRAPHPLKVGLLFATRNPRQWHQDWTALYRETLEQAVLAEELGFDGLFTSEHHFADDGYTPSCLVLEAAFATRTTRVDLGSFVILLPMHHPLRLAEDAATVDILSGGRLILGLGIGYRDEEFRAFAVGGRRSSRAIDEALQALLLSWTSDGPFSLDGECFQYTDVNVTPKPVQQPRPRVWLGHPGSPKNISRVARHQLDGFASHPPSAEVYARYLQECEQYGTRPLAAAQALFKGYVAPTTDAAQLAVPYAHYIHDTYATWNSGEARPLTDFGEAFVLGSPEDWIRHLDRVLRAREDAGTVPISYLIVQLQLPGMSDRQVRDSMRLFATEVMPALRDRTPQ